MALEDLLDSDLTIDQVRIRVEYIWQVLRDGGRPTRADELKRSKTLGTAKSLLEFYELVRQAINDYESRKGVSQRDKVTFTEEEPDKDAKTETITLGLVNRLPGAFQQGAPGEAKVRNMRPMFREEGEDADNPGYRFVVKGYWYDNIVRFTCWALTNKAANARAMWFEDLMEEYAWFFKFQGVDRVLYNARRADIVTRINGNRWYGRPIDYFVRTEELKVFSEKKIEEIVIKVMTKIE